MTDCGISFTSTNKTSNNPEGIPAYIKPGRVLAPASGAPLSTLGTAYDVYIDTSTGIEYVKNYETGQWDAIINYSTLPAAIPDPLALNVLEVNTIKGNATEAVQVNLGVSGALNIGPTGATGQVGIFADGTILTDSSTSNVIVANGSGVQIAYGSSSITGSTGDMSLIAAGNLILNPGTSVLCDQSIYTASGKKYSSQLDNTSGTLVAVDSVILKCTNHNVVSATTAHAIINPTTDITLSVSGAPILVVQASDCALSGDILPTASSTWVLGRNTNTWAEVHGDTVFAGNAGGATGPGFSFDADPLSGLYLNAVSNPAISVAGVPKMGFAATITSTMNHIYPTATNSYDLGSSSFDFRNIYSQNVLNVVSDARRKKNVDDLVLGLELIEKLRPVSFQFKDSPDERFKIGFIAQKTEEVMKECDKDYDVVNYDEDNDAYTMKYESLIGVLVNAMQELLDRVEKLEENQN